MYNPRVFQTTLAFNGRAGLQPLGFLASQEEESEMAKTVCKILGVIFVIVGVAGFIAPTLLGAHLSLAHNLVHVISGGAAMYFGFAGSASAARGFCLIFGVVYLLLGIAGFLLGHPGMSTLPGMAEMGTDPRMWQVLRGTLEFGQRDHLIHIVLGVIFLAGGAMGNRNR
jgi:Domain of unknown function (DUF4383)